MEVDDNVIMLDLTGDSKDCIMSNYGSFSNTYLIAET